MIRRREMLMGAACLAAAGGAWAMRPRDRLSLLGSGDLEKLIPNSFGGWEVQPTDALVVPEDEDSLASRLYSQIVGRLYTREDGAAVMLLVAYGDTQNDLLQLHRPESCYPAFGFTISGNGKAPVPLNGETAVPARFLTASRGDRVERILYWTRIGEHLPIDGSEQRMARLSDQFAGIVPDGVLVRISNLEPTNQAGLARNVDFARALLTAMPPQGRRALVGTDRASALARAA